MYISEANGETMKLDVLAIGAHPDDIELSCAATVAKLVKSGKKVAIVDLTQGELGTRGSKTIRKQEAENAAKILGVEFRDNLRIPDGNIEFNKKNITNVMESFVRTSRRFSSSRIRLNGIPTMNMRTDYARKHGSSPALKKFRRE